MKVTGCTVHFVDEGTDTGPIVAQAAVPVLDADTEESLQRRIQEQEHRLFPLALGLLASGRLRVEARRVHVEGGGARPGRPGAGQPGTSLGYALTVPTLPPRPRIAPAPARHVYDVLVIGAELGGALAAALLAKRGLRVLWAEHAQLASGYEHDGFLSRRRPSSCRRSAAGRWWRAASPSWGSPLDSSGA